VKLFPISSLRTQISSLGLAGLIVVPALLSAHGVQAASTIRFAAENVFGSEGDAIGLLLVIDPPLTTGDARVTLVQTGGSAIGSDFALSPPGAMISIPKGVSNHVVRLTLLDDGLHEHVETLELTLTNPSEGLILRDDIRALVAILNAGPRFRLNGGSGVEMEGFATVRGHRRGDTNVAFAVDYATIPIGPGGPGGNFVPTNGTLTVGPGERYPSFRVPILNDGRVAAEGYQTFGVYLTNATTGVEIDTAPVEVQVWDSQWPTTLDSSYRPKVGTGATAFTPNGEAWRIALHPQGGGDPLVFLNASGSVAARFPAVTHGFRDRGLAPRLAVQADGRILLFGGWHFPTFNGVPVPQPGFARLFPDGRLDLSFVPAAVPASDARPLLELLGDGSLLFYDGVALHRLRPDGESDPDFQVTEKYDVQALALDAQGRPLVAAKMASADGALTQVLRLDKTGAQDSAFAPVKVTGSVAKLAPQPDGKILVAGWFVSLNGLERTNLARLRTDGAPDETFDAGRASLVSYIPEWNGYSADLVQDGNKILIVTGSEGIWRLNSDGSLDRRFPVRFDGFSGNPAISSTKLHGGGLLVAGNFGAINGLPRPGLARLLLDEAPESAAAIAPRLDEYFHGEWNPAGYEGEGEAEVTVRRLGDVRQPATVGYVTHDGTAQAGQDYESVAGTLAFAAFESERSFRLPILDDDEVEREETLELRLNAGTGVAVADGSTPFTLHDDEVILDVQPFPGPTETPRCVLRFNQVPKRHYDIECSSDLYDWKSPGHSYDTGGSDGPGILSLEIEFSDSNRFFRVRRQP